MSYSVGQVADLAGVTVRTLHHYDEIKLLTPSGRTASGYRSYGDDDLERLQQILFYRELELSLEDIATILDDPHADAPSHLRRQHRLLRERIERLHHAVASVERALEAHHMDIQLTPEERFELFGDWLPDDYAEEAEQRWGDTEAYQQSQRRAASYTKDDWVQIKAEGDQVEVQLVAALAAGAAPDSEQAMDLAEAHRQQITRWFYDCGYDIHRGLAELYVTDARFTANYDGKAPGLARFISEAIKANADRAEAS